ARSIRPSSAIAGPSVMSRYKSEGGYFDVFRNESTVYTGFGCGDQGDGSPYTLSHRTTTKATVRASPSRRQTRRRSSDDCFMIGPNAYPTAMTPTQGIRG